MRLLTMAVMGAVGVVCVGSGLAAGQPAGAQGAGAQPAATQPESAPKHAGVGLTAEELAKVTLPATKPGLYELVEGADQIPHSPWRRYFTTDRFGRLITFYVNGAGGEGAALPLIVWVQGSGSQSVFTAVKTDSGLKLGAGGGQARVAVTG